MLTIAQIALTRVATSVNPYDPSRRIHTLTEKVVGTGAFHAAVGYLGRAADLGHVCATTLVSCCA